MIGTQILNYKVKSLLGEGGMGIVYLAEHVKLGRKVAIKVLHAHLASNESIRNRFMNEAKTMAELQHPNIVNLHDYHEDELGLYLIMEYVDGQPLDEYIEKMSGPIPEEKAIHFFKQALSAFQYAHEKNVVHRDIKPSNLIITNEGKLKVLDFGIAKIVGNDNYKLTKTGAHTGSVYYMSPEQVRGFDVDYRSDIYSLGITLYQMLTGYNPYVDLTTEYDIFEQIVKVPLADPRTKYPAVSEHMVQVINKSTQKNPLDRFNSCNDFSKSLDNQNADELLSVTKISEEEKTINVSDEILTNNKTSTALVDLTKIKVEIEPTVIPETKKKSNVLYIVIALAFFFIGLGWYLSKKTGSKQLDVLDTQSADIKKETPPPPPPPTLPPKIVKDEEVKEDEKIEEIKEDQVISTKTVESDNKDAKVEVAPEGNGTVVDVKKDDEENKIWTKVEKEAEYPGGDAAWRSFLMNNLRGEVPVDNGANAGVYQVIVRFIVSKDGSLSDISCESDPGYGMCSEAVRVIKKTKSWRPANQNGREVNAYRRQPITFQVEEQ